MVGVKVKWSVTGSNGDQLSAHPVKSTPDEVLAISSIGEERLRMCMRGGIVSARRSQVFLGDVSRWSLLKLYKE